MDLLFAKSEFEKPTTLEEVLSDVEDIHTVVSLFVNHLDARRVDIYDKDDVELVDVDDLSLVVKSFEVYKIPRKRNKVQLRVRV